MIATILPLFLLIGAGFVAIRSRYLGPGSVAPLGAFVIRIALPALIFHALAQSESALSWRYLLAYGAGSLATWGLAFAAARGALSMPRGHAALAGLGASASNSGFIGYPVALSVIGDGAAQVLAHCMIVETMLILPLSLMLVDLSRGDIDGETDAGGTAPAGAPNRRGRVVARSLRAAVTNPILIAVFLSLVVKLTGLPLPGPFTRAFELMSAVAAPVALFVIGGMLATLPFEGGPLPVAGIAATKLLLHPALVAVLMLTLPGIPPEMRAAGLIFAAAPMISIFPIIGQGAGLGNLTAAAMISATVASFATLPLWLGLAQSVLGG
ncbi:AEC family transporter [Mesobaculum littorinae]|nr:AEC family transporter [Mesobaculum littorinae]